MKKMFVVLAATLICGASVFTSCKKDEDNNNPSNVANVANVAEKIMGRWMTASVDGQALPTNEKIVYNFISTTTAYISSSFGATPDFEAQWVYLSEANVVIDGNKVTITHHLEAQQTVCQELTITSINDNELTANGKLTATIDGNIVDTKEETVRFVKTTTDYSAAILGMWEGRMTSDESVYGDAEDHRWEYLMDGTFNYFRKVDGQWQISDDDYADYFVAGSLLCTRWKNAGVGNEEHREWWEIESIENGVMRWKALRKREDGTTYTATFEMSKVN